MISTISRTIDCGVKNSPPSRPSAHGEVGEEVLVDQPEGVAGERARERREQADELDERALLELLVAAREHGVQARCSSPRSRPSPGRCSRRDPRLRAARRGTRAGRSRARTAPRGRGSRRRSPAAAPSPSPRARAGAARSGARRTRGRSARAPGRGTAPASASSSRATRRPQPTGAVRGRSGRSLVLERKHPRAGRRPIPYASSEDSEPRGRPPSLLGGAGLLPDAERVFEVSGAYRCPWRR